MSGELCHHSDEATGPESCGWIKRHRKKYRYYLEQTSASALRGRYAPGLQKQSSMYLDSADVVRDVETRHYTHLPSTFNRFRCEVNRKKSKFECNALLTPATPQCLGKCH